MPVKNEKWTEDLYLYRMKPAPPNMEDFQEYIALYFAETLWTRTQKADHETGAADNK